jgi:hypothetical protein
MNDNTSKAIKAYQLNRPNPHFAAARTQSLADLLLTRSDWPRLQLAQNDMGSWDIVIRVDGGYGDRDDAERVLGLFAVDAARLAFPGEELPYAVDDDDLAA